MNDPSNAEHSTPRTVPAARNREELTRSLQPGPPALIAAVTELLEHTPISHEPGSALQLLRRAHDSRAEGPQPMDPGEAATLLQAVVDRHVRDACTGWHDQAASWLWSDLITTAPPGWIAPVATLAALTAYQQHDLDLAALATRLALTDQPHYQLAHLVQLMLRHAVPPATVRALIAEAQTLLSAPIDLNPTDDEQPRPTTSNPTD